MNSKEVRSLMEAYASVHEGYGKKKKEKDCVDKEDKGEHNCAKKVCHEQFGEGTCIFGEHAVPDENGFVSHYDVMFGHGIERNVSVTEMQVLVSESHMKEGHRYEGEQISEGPEEYSGGQHPSKSSNKKDRDRYETETRRRQAPTGVGVPDKKTGYGQLQQSADLFDIVKGHLMSEGFADTEEAALAIMANMSEEWRQSIIEEVGIVGPPKKAIDAIPGVRNARIAASNAVKRSDYGPNDEVKKVGKHVVPSARLGGQFDRPGGTKYKDISGDK